MGKLQIHFSALYTRISQNKFYIVFVILGVLLPLIQISLLLNRYAVNVPFGDDWAMVPTFQHIDHGTLSFHDLWAQHNEHRILFPRLAIIALAYTTNWHLGSQMIASVLISIFSLLLILLLVWHTISNKWIATITSVIISVWFYSTAQWENWLWGWQIEWFMCVSAILLTIYLIRRSTCTKKPSIVAFVAAIAAAIVATFSLGSGILVWPIILVWLILSRQTKLFTVWGCLGLMAVAVYYFHYVKPPNSPSVLYALHHPKVAIQYFLIYLGRPMSDQLNAAATWGGLLLGLLVIVLYLLWTQRKHIERFLPWLAILAFSLAAGALTTISRVGFGLDQAVSSRYTTISLLFIISLTCIIAVMISLREIEAGRIAVLGLVVLSVPLLVSTDVQGLQGFRDRSVYMRIVKSCTHEPRPTKECLLVTIPGQGLDRPSLQYIKNKHWGGY